MNATTSAQPQKVHNGLPRATASRMSPRVNERPAEFESLLELIAKTHLGCETLKVRNRDSLDFFDCGVASLRNALAYAFAAGQEFGRQQAAHRQGQTTGSKQSGAKPDPAA